MTPADLAELRIRLLAEDNGSAERFLGMGFTLNNLTVDYVAAMNTLQIRAEFTCVCGRRETFQNTMMGYAFRAEKHTFSIYERIDYAGALGREHLLQDGYTSEQIEAMERRLDEWRTTRTTAPKSQYAGGLSARSVEKRKPVSLSYLVEKDACTTLVTRKSLPI